MKSLLAAALAVLLALPASPAGAAGHRSRRGLSVSARPLMAARFRHSSSSLRLCRRLMGNLGRTDRYDSIIMRHALRRRLDPRLVKAVVAVESEFQPRALSNKGARGLMQLMPRTARELGVSAGALYDPEHNIRAGTRYLAALFTAAGSVGRGGRGGRYAPSWQIQRVLAAYHAGPGALSRRRLHSSTREYVRLVMLLAGSEVSRVRASGRL